MSKDKKWRDRRKFAQLIANGEILYGVTSPADRRNLEMFCEDYTELLEQAEKLAEAIRSAKNAIEFDYTEEASETLYQALTTWREYREGEHE